MNSILYKHLGKIWCYPADIISSIMLFLKSISDTRTQPNIPPWEIAQIISSVREPILAESVEPVPIPHSTSISSNHCWFR